MAQRTEIVLLDDIEREYNQKDVTADRTVRFGYEGVEYEIDLTAANANGLADQFFYWIAAARKVGKASPPNRTGKKSKNPQNATIRAWARENGWPDLSERGRLPQEITDAFHTRAGA